MKKVILGFFCFFFVSVFAQKVGCYRGDRLYGIADCLKSTTVGQCCSLLLNRKYDVKHRRRLSQSDPTLERATSSTSERTNLVDIIVNALSKGVSSDKGPFDPYKIVTINCSVWFEPLERFLPLKRLTCTEGSKKKYDNLCKEQCGIKGVPIRSFQITAQDRVLFEKHKTNKRNKP